MFQKCVPRGGYRAQIWTKLGYGFFIWWGSRHKCQGTIEFSGVFIKIR